MTNEQAQIIISNIPIGGRDECYSIAEYQSIDNQKYKVCCPLCDNEECVKGTDRCEAERWKERKLEEMEVRDRYEG